MRDRKDEQGRIRIDEKHSIETYYNRTALEWESRIVKSTNNIPIPDDEPQILFRGRDKLAIKMLENYKLLCIEDGATAYQIETLDKMIIEFKEWQKENQNKLKQPGSTLGK